MYSKIIFLMLSCLIGVTVGQLRCYTCGFSVSDTDDSCLTITNSTRQVDCRFQYCTIFRQEFVDPAGVVASFIRGCEQTPDFLNHDIVDPTFRTYYRACTSDLCNLGNGVESVIDGVLSAQTPYRGENLLVPGTSRSPALNLKTCLLLLVIGVFSTYCF